MSLTFWPSALPQAPLPGLRGGPQRAKVFFQPDRGPSIDRLGASSVVRNASFSFDLTSFEQLRIFEEWYNTDLRQGSLPFLMVDVHDDHVYEWKFSTDDPPYETNSDRGTYVVLSMKLQRLARWNG